MDSVFKCIKEQNGTLCLEAFDFAENDCIEKNNVVK